MRYLIFLLLLTNVAFADNIPTPKPDEKLSVETQEYLETISDNLHKAEITTSRPNGSRTGKYGEYIGWATGSTIELYICDSSPDGTSWHKVDTNSPAPASVDTDRLVKGWVNFNGESVVGVNCTINDSYNVTSVSHTATGCYTITWDTNFSDANYVISGMSGPESGGSYRQYLTIEALAAGSAKIQVWHANGNKYDTNPITVMAVGN